MNKPVTVDEAIAKGHRMVNYPVMLIMIGTLGVCFYLGINEILPQWIIPLGFVLAFGLAWLYWSFMITKWRLWAFQNVRNVRQLKKRAVQEKLIWPDNSIFEKTEIRNAMSQRQWNSLQKKFDQDDVFTDNLRIPNETVVYYSKSKLYAEMAVLIGCVAAGLYFLVEGTHMFVSLISLVCIYFIYEGYKKMVNTTPQIVINNNGIRTINTDFYEWRDIENEEITISGSGNNTRFYLTYNYPGGAESLTIENFTIDHRELEQLLIVYRGRNKMRYGLH
jgi:hypothetical protein